MENQTVTLNAPAKINLSLNIGNKRSDGFHDVRMIMQSISCYDEVTVSLTDTNKIEIECNLPYIPTNEKNLAYKATEAFYSNADVPFTGVHITLDKHIPVCAGLAGGSTDCAAVLKALNTLHSDVLDKKLLINIGGELGKDVPFCFKEGCALAEGTGTTLTWIKSMPLCYILLVKPEVNISTKEAYSKADLRPKKIDDSIEKMRLALEDGNLLKICSYLNNDFEEVIELSEIKKIKSKLLVNGAIGAAMSGSGPTVYGIFDDLINAEKAMNIFQKSYRDVHLCRPL